MKKQVIKFEITKDDTAEKLRERMISLTARMFLNLEIGHYQMEIGKPKRTLKQNDTIHAIFREISNTMAEHGIDQNLVIKARPTEENIKKFFTEKYLNGKRTSEVKTDELARALDSMMESFNEFFTAKGLPIVRIDSQDLKSLLNSQK